MNNEQKTWKTLADVQSFRTSDPRMMLGKYLAEPVKRTWTEDFIDSDTGEIVSVERNEILMSAGLHLDKERIATIQFHIQAEDISDVCVCDECIDANRFIGRSLIPCEVTIFSPNQMKKLTYLVRASSLEAAIRCISNYAPLYLQLHGGYSVQSAKAIPCTVVEDDDYAVKANPDIIAKNSEYEYYKTSACAFIYNEEKEKLIRNTRTLIIKASDVGEAKNRTRTWMLNNYKEELRDSRNSVVVEKAQPYDTAGIVPIEYCEIFKEKSNL